MDNSTTFDFQLNQFGSWYMLAGIECYLESADMTCQCETLLAELDRLEAWERENGGYYHLEYVPEGFAALRDRILGRLADIESWESQWYAEQRRGEFTVIEGGRSGNSSQ